MTVAAVLTLLMAGLAVRDVASVPVTGESTLELVTKAQGLAASVAAAIADSCATQANPPPGCAQSRELQEVLERLRAHSDCASPFRCTERDRVLSAADAEAERQVRTRYLGA